MSTEAQSAKREILLVGFGAVGAIYSYILKQSGRAKVSVVARSNYNVINNEGLQIKSAKYGDHKGWKPDAVYKSIVDATAQVGGKGFDYVVVATKAIPELSTTPQLLEPLLSRPYTEQYSQPVYVLLQNGLGVEKDLYEAIKKVDDVPKIASAAVWIGTNLVSESVVEHGPFDRVTLGMYRHNDRTTATNTPEEQSILDDFGGLLRDGGTELTIVPEIQRMKFAKNFWNVGFSSFATLSGYTLPAMFRPPPPSNTPNAYAPYRAEVTAEAVKKYAIPQIKAIFDELLVLGRALGYPDSPEGLPSSVSETTLKYTASLHASADSTHKPSMMLDMERGQPLEVEVILGEVVRMAEEVGVAVPRVEMLYGLLLVVQNQILRVRQDARPTATSSL